MYDSVKKPAHYNFGSIEVIDAINDWGLNYMAGNVVKYVARYRHKGSPLEDLKKAKEYLERLIVMEEKLDRKTNNSFNSISDAGIDCGDMIGKLREELAEIKAPDWVDADKSELLTALSNKVQFGIDNKSLARDGDFVWSATACNVKPEHIGLGVDRPDDYFFPSRAEREKLHVMSKEMNGSPKISTSTFDWYSLPVGTQLSFMFSEEATLP